jgi:ribonuclease HI
MPRAKKEKVITLDLFGEHHVSFEAEARARGLRYCTLYTDGSCPENSRRPGDAPMGAGIVGICGQKTWEWSYWLGNGTNQIAELEAIRRGLLALKERGKTAVRLYTDSEYCVGILTLDWHLRKNVELACSVRALWEECALREVLHVEGHTGVAGNERADELAGQAVRTQGDWHGVRTQGYWHGVRG